MPLITVSMYPGRSEDQKKEFAKEVTDMAVKILNKSRTCYCGF
ncbi:MAG: tautomerase family protein [Nitrososphaeraceae archaeon]